MAAGQGLAVVDIAQRFLTAVVDHYAAADGIELPERRIIAGGTPRAIAWDCDQLVITMSSIGLGPAPGLAGTPQRAGSPISAGGVRHAVFQAQVVRCVPSGDGERPPAAADLTKAGTELMRDAGLLSQALVEACTRIRDGLPKGSAAQPGLVEMLGPDGGYAAVEGQIAVTVGTLA